MKIYFLLMGAVVIVATVGGLWFTSQPAVAPARPVHALVQIGEAAPASLQLPAGTTALVATAEVAEVTTHGEGEVTALDGVVADTGKHQAWQLLINGAAAPVEAGAYVVQMDDILHWVIGKDN